MATYVFLNDILLPLSHSLGEESIPGTVPQSRLDAVQYAIERVSRLYDFDWSKQVFTQTLVNGSGALDSSIRTDAAMDVRQIVSGTGNDNVFQEVPQPEFDNYTAGDYRYYISYAPATTGLTATIVTAEPTITSIQIIASLAAPTISATVGVAFPSAKVLADFALVNLRRYEDKDADTSVEEAIAQQGLNEIEAIEQRNNPTGRAKNRYEKTGHHTGEIGGSYIAQWNSNS